MLGLILTLLALDAQSQCIQSTVANDQGQTTVYACTSDGNADEIIFTTSNTGTASYNYVVTDDQNNILGLPPGNSLDFEGVPAGTCRVWGLSYDGNITAMPGDNAATVDLSDGCFQLSDNFISVVRFDDVFAGTVVTDGGDTDITLCVGDDESNFVTFGNYNETDNLYTFIITDSDGNILGITPTGTDFNGAGPGNCLVYGLSYIGNITAAPGDNINTTILADDCYDLTVNNVTVNRIFVNGGTVAMPSGATEINTCAGDGIDDIVMFTNTSDSDATYAYVITDADSNILGINPGDSQNFDGAGEGNCQVYGLSYTGNITAQAGDNIDGLAFSDGCFDLSDNAITVIRTGVDAGTVAMPSGATTRYTCPGDGVDDIVMFTTTSESNANFTYVITDADLNILGIPPGDSQNFEGAGEGNCLVWGLSFTGNLTAQAGDNVVDLAFSDGCFDLSDNAIEIIRIIPDGGTVVTDFGETEIDLCVGDGVSDFITFGNYEESDNTYIYIVTDEDDNVLAYTMTGIDFEGAGEGNCHVWGLSYGGALNMQTGVNIFDIDFTDACYALSTNFVTVNRYSGIDCEITSPANMSNTASTKLTSNAVTQIDIQLAPNPAVDLLTVSWTAKANPNETAVISIYSLDGKRVYQNQTSVVEGYNQFDVEVNEFQAGLYLLLINDGQTQKTQKFIKQ